MHRVWSVRLTVLLPGGSRLLACCLKLPCLTCFLLSRGCHPSIFLCGAAVSYLLVLPPQDWSILTCRLLIESCRVSLHAAVLTGSCSSFHLPYADWRLPSLSTCRLLTRGCSSFHLPTSWRLLEASIDLPAASPWMRGGGRLTCDLDDRRAKWSYLLPRHRCEAAVALPAALLPGCSSRLTPRLAGYARRLSHYLRHGCRSRFTCRHVVNVRQQSTYLPPRRGCEAAVNLLADLLPGWRSRPTCRLGWRSPKAAVVLLAALAGDHRRPQSSYLPPCRGYEAAVDLPATWEARRPKSSYLPPRRGCEAAVAQPATSKNKSRSRLTCCLVENTRRLSSTCRLALDARRLSHRLRPGCRSRHTRCLVVDARRLSPYLLR